MYNSLNRFGDKVELTSQKMIASKCEILVFSKEKYQERVVLEKKIKAAMDKKASDNGFYTIIAGVKGAGKTTLVEKLCQNRTGVIRIAVNNEDNINTITNKLLDVCLPSYQYASIRQTSMNSELQAAFIKAAKQKGNPIVVIFDVERLNTTNNALSSIKHFAKMIAPTANVLIVLSEGNAVLEFGGDSRQKFIWVDEMTEEEATINSKKIGINEKYLGTLFSTLGRLPLTLRNCRDALDDVDDSDKPFNDFVNEELSMAKNDLAAFQHQVILVALKEKPQGVRSGTFKGIKNEGILLSEPKDVAIAMKKRNCIMYHFPSGEYRLASQAHKTALISYEPLKETK